ncbi:unnamed protein product [Symbiodinium natans]|uniref:Pseudouridine synthase RsuA/RluA-like domain-containing protein n=1 Tax=Symbiodinium natans TaxID=878477 RepID=A0A812UEH1_9DINO|nr:unnamed protein product [Symbiodinium natans]
MEALATTREFNYQIRACGSKWSEALWLLQVMPEANCDPNVVSYTWALQCCLRGGAPDVAQEILCDMAKLEVPPDAKSCTAAIRTCADGALWEHALSFLSLMPAVQVPVNVVAYNSAIYACGRGRWEAALEVLSSMSRQQIPRDIISYSSAIKACSTARKWEQALQVLEHADGAGLALDAKIFSSAVDSCLNQWPAALELLRCLRQKRLPPDVYSQTAALAALAAAGEWRRSLALLFAMPKAKVFPTVVTYGAAISACDKGSQWQLGLSLLQLMNRRQVPPDRVCVSSAVAACGRALRWDHALALVSSSPAMQLVSDFVSWSSVVAACASAFSWSEALSLALTLRDEAPEGFAPNGILWGGILGAMARARQDTSELAEHLRSDWGARTALQAEVVDQEELGEGLRCVAAAPGLLAVAKPAGITSEAVMQLVSRWRAKQGLSTQIMRLSRLDAQTSGVLPVALAPCGSGVTSWYQLQFAARKVRKKYLLLCSGKPLPDGVQGTIVAPLVSGPSTEQSAMKSVWSSAGKEARTVYKVLRTFTLPLQTLMLVQAEPQTGRTHQIRAHFAGIGRPILCDRTYGGFDPSWCPRLFLHCRQVALQDVAGRPFAAEAPLSAELQEALGHLQDLAAG